jgi:gliding motility-associated-like protein
MYKVFRYIKTFTFVILAYIVNAQCPTVEAIMVDACGTEEFNEFIVINSGTAGFNTNDLELNLDIANNSGVQNSDININATPCGLTAGNISAYTGCSNLISIGAGFDVPPNSILILQTSTSSTASNYDFSSLCGLGQCVYVVSSNCQRDNGAFTNNGAGSRTTIFSIAGSCIQSMTYSMPLLVGGQGAFYQPLTNSYGNSGCAVPPSSPAPGLASVDQPANIEVCGGQMVSSIFTGTGTSYEWINSNTSIGLGASGTGNISFNSANVASTQIGTITVFPQGSCPGTPKMFTITVNPSQTPTFTQIPPICAGGSFTLPTTSMNGIAGSWAPAINNTMTMTYTFTPDPLLHPCGAPVTMEVIVNPIVTPDFTQIPPRCSGAAITLPSTSNNGISGMWSPAINNTMTMLYTFTPDPIAHPCANMNQMTVVVNPTSTPDFMQIGPICSGTPFTLPLTSPNGITGMWSPVANNTATTLYTFTPDPLAHPCANPATMTVNVIPQPNPEFTQIEPVCFGGVINLPSVSNNGISGTWSPAINNTMTITYTFSPDLIAHPCANIANMTVMVNMITSPSFTQIEPVCQGSSFTLPLTSTNGITGIWSPAINNTNTTLYTFTPDPILHPCAGPSMMTVDIEPPAVPALGPFGPYCNNGASVSLPLVQDGITGTWSGAILTGNSFNPSVLAPGIYTITFNPAAGECAVPNSTQIEVIENPIGNISGNPILCPDQCGQVFFNFSGGSGTYSINMNIDAGLFNFNFPMVGITNSTILNICSKNGLPFDPSSNTINIPTFISSGSYSLTLLNFFSIPSGSCTTGIVGVPGEISISLVSAPQINTASLNSCDDDQDGNAVFDLTSVDNIVTNNLGTNSVTWFTDEANLNIISVPSAFSSGNATVYARVTNPDGCSATVPVTLTLDPPVILNLTDFSSCINGPVIGLPVVVDGYAGVWSGLNISGGNQFNPAGLNTGTYPITFSPTGGFCVAPITVNVNITSAGPVPLNSPIATTCSGDASAVLSNQQGGISGVWSGSPFLTGNIFNISASGAGTFTVTFTPNGSGSCFSPNTTQVVVIPNTVLTPVNFSDVCSGSSIINLGTVVDGEMGSWSGNTQIVGNTFNPNTTAGDYPVIFTPTKNCVTGFTTNIKVLPFITLTPPALGPTCVNGATIALPSSINSVSGTWTLNGSPITTFNPGTSGTGNFTLNFNPDPTACALPFNTTISVGQINAGKDSISTLCSIHQDTINLNNFLSAGSTSGGEWKLNNILISNPTKYSLATLSAGNHIFSYILNDVSCGRDTALITFNITFPNNAGNNSQSILCSDNTSSVDFNSLLGTHRSGGTWTQPFGSNIDLSNISNVDLSSLAAGSYEFKYILPAGVCPSDTSITLFDIKTFNSAGVDDNSTLCLGTEIDLINLVNTSFIGGNIVNPSGISGLTGSIWNTSGLLSGQYTFLYVVNNPAPCLSDTSELVINLAASVSAGNDISDFFCENATLDLNSYLSSGASAGGKFFLNGVEIINGNYTTNTQTNLQFIYKVGDGLTCPEDTAFITLGPILKPGVNVTGLKDICENDCQDITIIHSIPAGAQIAISMTTSTGIKYNITNPVLNSNPINLYICPVNNGPYSFNNPPIGETLSIKIENVTLQNNHCIFEYTDDYELRTIPLPTRLINKTLCKGEVFMIGNDLYSEIKPNGISVIPSSDPAKCDSLITVNLSFMDPSPVTNINTVTCDQNYSILVGSTTFNRSNPMGTVMLTNKFGCDSLISIRITYNLPSTGSYTESTCDANKLFNIGNQVFDKVNPAGNVTLPGANIFGCDSIVLVQINYLNASAFQLTNTTCDDAYILSVGGQTFSKNNPSGSVTLSGMAANGCDSIVNVNITYLSKPIGSYTLNTCDDNFTYTGGNVVFNKVNPTGSFILTSAASNGCDSIVNVQINFSDFNISNALLYNCDGSDPKITLNLASHPGPYTINIDGQQIATNQNLPFTTSITSGNHTLFISTPAGCEESILVSVEDTKGPDVMLTQSPNPDGTIRINVIAPQNVIYDLRWSPASSLSCNNCFDPIANPAEKTTYTLDYKYSSDCEGQRMISVQRINTDITLPNIFTPDGDGSNDIFFVVLPENINGTVKNMAIYDRWGNQLFSAKDVPANQPSAGWSGMFKGDPVQPGVYVYLIVLQIDGKAGTDKYAGSITVIR